MSSVEPGVGHGPTKTVMEFEPAVGEIRARPFLFLVLEAERPLAGGARFALEDLGTGRESRGRSGKTEWPREG